VAQGDWYCLGVGFAETERASFELSVSIEGLTSSATAGVDDVHDEVGNNSPTPLEEPFCDASVMIVSLANESGQRKRSLSLFVLNEVEVNLSVEKEAEREMEAELKG
jgi:hypothetical protein